MKAAVLTGKVMAIAMGILVSLTATSQEYSAGINTETPNANAVLHLVAPNGDQGLIIPTLTTSQRTATAFVNNLGLNSNNIGLLVFDSDTQQFYFWSGSNWTPLLTSVTTNEIVDGSILDVDIQDVDWNKILNVPAGFADGIDHGLSVVNVDGTTITGDGNATQLAVGTVPAAQISGLSTVATTGNFADLLTIPTGLADGDDVGLTAVTVDGTTITGDGNATQLAVGTVPAGQVSGLSTIATSGSFADLTTSIVINTTLTGTGISGNPLGVNVGTGANQIVQLNGSNQLPAVDGSQLVNMADMFQSTYDPNTVSGDAFDLSNHTTSTAPARGEVLTFDGSIWDAAPVSLTLPYSQSATDASDLFYLTNSGAGGTGFFEIINSGNGSNALSASTDGSGAAFRASQSGTGTAIDVAVSNGSNSSAGIFISHAGTGAGLDVTLGGSNPSPGINIFHTGSGASISANNTGTGAAGIFQVNNGTSTSPVIQVVNTGVGADIQLPTGATAGYVLTASDAAGNAAWQPGVGLSLPYSQTVLNGSDLFNLTNTGTGGAGSFNINNGANPANALNASTTGTGAAIRAVQGGAAGPGMDLSISGAANTSPGMLISHAGLGTGLDISLNLATNTGNGITVNHAGLGSAGSFSASNGLNTFPALNASTVGTGPAIEARSTGAGPDLRLSGTIPIQITASPTAGYVLTSDGSGFGTWQPASGAFTQDVNNNLLAITGAAPTGSGNFIAGNAAVNLTTGNDNIAIGEAAGGTIVSGSDNIFMGFDVGGGSLSGGSGNILLGSGGRNSDDSDNNVGIGQGVIMAGGSSTVIGSFSSATGTNSMALGNNVSVTSANTAVIGSPFTPMNVGIGTATPNARLDVVKLGGETGDVLNLTHNGGSGRGIYVNNASGSGEAGRFEITNSGNSADAVFVSTLGGGNGVSVGHGGTSGSGLVVDFTDPTNPFAALEVANASLGTSANFRSTNTATVEPAIRAETSSKGAGSVAIFDATDLNNSADAVIVRTAGTGSAGQFVINNTSNNKAVLFASTTGTGDGLAMDHTGTSGNAVAINHSPTATSGRGIIIDMNGAGDEGLLIGGTAPGVNSIDVDGGIKLSTVLISTPATATYTPVVGTPLPNSNRILRIDGIATFDAITAGVDGQEIILVCAAGGPTAQDGTGNLYLDSNSSFVMQPGSTLHLVWIESFLQWLEIGRSK